MKAYFFQDTSFLMSSHKLTSKTFKSLILTPGIKWTLKGQKYQKSSLCSQTSFKAVQWLYSEQESERCLDKNGNRVTMEHSYHQGEKTIFDAKLDGYAYIDNRHVVWEFNGCKWHGCLKCFPDWFNTATVDQVVQKSNWNKKIQRLRRNNCVIHVMWEHDFVPNPSIKTRMPRILQTDSENTLLEGIRAGEIFGFAKCSVRTPQELIQKFKEASFLFPPIIQRADITEDLIGPFMKEKMTEQDRKAGQSTLIQTFNGDDLLLMTPLIAFYLENGIKVFNIKGKNSIILNFFKQST